jgi:hypothetical protein
MRRRRRWRRDLTDADLEVVRQVLDDVPFELAHVTVTSNGQTLLEDGTVISGWTYSKTPGEQSGRHRRAITTPESLDRCPLQREGPQILDHDAVGAFGHDGCDGTAKLSVVRMNRDHCLLGLVIRTERAPRANRDPTVMKRLVESVEVLDGQPHLRREVAEFMGLPVVGIERFGHSRIVGDAALSGGTL